VLDKLISSSARVKVLRLLLLNEEKRYYQREIAELAGLPVRAVQREGARLTEIGLLRRIEDGNRVYFQANAACPIFAELKRILLKTVALELLLSEPLAREGQIEVAFIYGSYAADRETATSDVDLFVIGSISSRQLSAALRPVQTEVQREFSYHLVSPEEFRERLSRNDGFLRNVIEGPKVFVIGNEETLRTLAARMRGGMVMGKQDMTESMLSVEEALERVLGAFHPLEPERVPILEALGRVLAGDVYAGVDVPPHANSSMDGYAVLAADTAGAGRRAPSRLRVIGELAAGYVTGTAVAPGTAIRIMTGAPIPPGADAVVRVEDTAAEGEWVEVFAQVPVGQYVRPAGEDVRRGELVLRRGTIVRPQEVGMLATLGQGQVPVTRRPRVAILATGDEVVEIDAPLAPGKIRNANSYSNAAQVVKHGGTPVMLGIARDRVEELTQKISAGLAQGVDLFLTSGGVSVGDFDLVKDVLAAEGEINFWRVRMKPGKPLAFGRIGGVPVLGLPGNPVSVMVSFEMFVRPAILKMLGVTGWERPTVEATLMDGVKHKDERRHYLRVRVEAHEGEHRAYLTGGQGSGILSSMVKANGLAIIPEDWTHAEAGARVRVMMLD